MVWSSVMQTYPSSTWIQDISPLKNFKHYMQTEGKNKKSWKLNTKLDPANPVATSSKDCTEVRGITFSSYDNWPQVAHASLLQLRPSGGNSALPKITPTKPGGQEAPHTHAPHSNTSQSMQNPDLQTWNEFSVFEDSYAGRKHKDRDMPKFLLELHRKTFAHFSQWSIVSPFSLLTRLLYFYSKPQNA